MKNLREKNTLEELKQLYPIFFGIWETLKNEFDSCTKRNGNPDDILKHPKHQFEVLSIICRTIATTAIVKDDQKFSKCIKTLNRLLNTMEAEFEAHKIQENSVENHSSNRSWTKVLPKKKSTLHFKMTTTNSAAMTQIQNSIKTMKKCLSGMLPKKKSKPPALKKILETLKQSSGPLLVYLNRSPCQIVIYIHSQKSLLLVDRFNADEQFVPAKLLERSF